MDLFDMAAFYTFKRGKSGTNSVPADGWLQHVPMQKPANPLQQRASAIEGLPSRTSRLYSAAALGREKFSSNH